MTGWPQFAFGEGPTSSPFGRGLVGWPCGMKSPLVSTQARASRAVDVTVGLNDRAVAIVSAATYRLSVALTAVRPFPNTL